MSNIEEMAALKGLQPDQFLRLLYVDEKKSCSEIAKVTGVSSMTVHKRLVKFNIPRRDTSAAMKAADLSGPKNPMYGKRWTDEHKNEHSKKVKAAIEKRGGHWSKGINMTAESVEKRKRFGPDNHNYKTGIKIHNCGYILIKNRESPSANSDGFVYKHRDVMEKFLGRRLLSSEIVHHIDGNPQNNNIDNLLIVTAEEHNRLHGKLKKINLRKRSNGSISQGSDLR